MAFLDGSENNVAVAQSTEYQDALEQASNALRDSSRLGFGLARTPELIPSMPSVDSDMLLAGGIGLAAGSTATALGQYGLNRYLIEPIAKTGLSIGLNILGQRNLAMDVLHGPGLPWHKLLTPKPIALGGAAAAALAIGGYELYKYLGSEK